MIQDILTAIPLGILLSFMVGPVFFVLLETSALKGFRAAMAFDLGVILADIVFILVAYGSSYRLILSIRDDPGIFIFGGVIMVSYGLISYVKLNKVGKRLRTEEPDATVELIKKNYGNLFMKGFLLNFINVGVLFFWFLILISIGPKLEMQTARIVTFFGSVLGSYLVIDIFKVLAAKQLKSRLTPLNILKIKRIIAIMLIIFGLGIASQAWFPSDQKLVKKALEKIE